MKTNEKNVVQSNKMGKLILEYALWTVIALIFGIGYMYLIFLTFGGSFEEETNVVSFIYSKMIFFGLLYMGLAIGSILAVLFIILDIFYLKRKLKYFKHKFIIRVFFMLFILAFMSPIHYLLEKTLDWI